MTMGGEKTGRSLYLYSENPVYDASPSIWLERGSPQDIQTPLEKVFGTPPKIPKIPFQEVFGCARIVKASKDCNKHSQAFHVGVSTVCKNLRIALDSGWFFVGLHPSHPKATKVCVGHKIFQKATPGKKNTSVFLQKKIMRVKKNSSPNPTLGYLDMSFTLLLCEAWFQILAGESHVADLAAAPGCRDPQGGRMDEWWVMSGYTISPWKTSTRYMRA